MMIVRPLENSDLPFVLSIYNDAVRHSTAVYTEQETSLAERKQWLANRRSQGYPVLAAIEARSGRLMGYASFGDFRAWPGYGATVEHSVYVDPLYQRRGVAKTLIKALFIEARMLGKHVMIGGIDIDNVASIKLHEHLGFEKVGILKEVGRKFDRWLSLVFMQRFL